MSKPVQLGLLDWIEEDVRDTSPRMLFAQRLVEVGLVPKRRRSSTAAA